MRGASSNSKGSVTGARSSLANRVFLLDRRHTGVLKCTYNSRGGLCRLEAESRDEKDECTKVKVREAFELRLEKRQAIIGELTKNILRSRVCVFVEPFQ